MSRLLIGLAAGAAIGLLLAPEKGADLREKIAQKKDDYMQDLEDKFTELKDRLERGFGAMKQTAEDITEDVQRNMDQESGGTEPRMG